MTLAEPSPASSGCLLEYGVGNHLLLSVITIVPPNYTKSLTDVCASSSGPGPAGKLPATSQSLRALLLDTKAGVTEPSRDLLAAAWAQTNMVIDSAGLTKMKKIDARRSRDDAASALLLAAGEQARRPTPVELRGAVISKSGEVTWL